MFTEGGFDSQMCMPIRVHVTPNAREVSIVKIDGVTFEVRIDEKAMRGRANKKLLEIMSEHFEVPKSRVFIVRGAKSRDKIIEVLS
jgi:uncharacterized protein (TIGR00251 family)